MSEDIKPEDVVEETKSFPIPTPVAAPVPTPVPAPIPTPPAKAKEVKIAVPVAVDIVAVKEELEAALPVAAGPAVTGSGTTDDVMLSAIVYKNMYSRRSLSVYHTQRRLAELGYTDASIDNKGFYGEATRSAIAKFQATNMNRPAASGYIDAETLTALFKGDPNVTVIV